MWRKSKAVVIVVISIFTLDYENSLGVHSGHQLTSAPGTAQQPQRPSSEFEDAVELRADLVTVTVTVTSSNGVLVGDLRQEDFEIIENDLPQRIITFSRHLDLPLSLVMVFDASMSVKSRLGFEKDAVARFFRTIVRPIDRVAVISVSTDITMEQPFTTEVNQLLSAINRISAEGATALYDAVDLASVMLSERQGRRVIVVLSDGRDTISRTPLLGALRRAQEADTIIYAINTAGRPNSANVRDLAGERALETFCLKTGGEVLFPDKIEELDPAFTRLAEQLRTQYILGYISTNEARDGSFRRVKVKVKRPNVQARSREGYYALKL